MVKFAARCISEEKISGAIGKLDPNYSCFTFENLTRVLKYREECIRVAEAVVSPLLESMRNHSLLGRHYYPCGHKISLNDRLSRKNYLSKVADALHENPCGTVLDLLKCPNCSAKAASLPPYLSMLRASIKEKIEKLSVHCIFSIFFLLLISHHP